ncbi:LINE-1 reverse transcriptase homolog [Linum grandiflorum]
MLPPSASSLPPSSAVPSSIPAPISRPIPDLVSSSLGVSTVARSYVPVPAPVVPVKQWREKKGLQKATPSQARGDGYASEPLSRGEDAPTTAGQPSVVEVIPSSSVPLIASIAPAVDVSPVSVSGDGHASEPLLREEEAPTPTRQLWVEDTEEEIVVDELDSGSSSSIVGTQSRRAKPTLGDFLSHEKVPPKRGRGRGRAGVRVNNALALFSSRFPGWLVDYCYDGSLGKIWLLWRPGVRLRVMCKSSQFIHVAVEHAQLTYYTFVYASTSSLVRRDMYTQIAGLAPSNAPWIVSGDFNAILSLEEASDSPSSFVGMVDFQNFARDCNLEEHRVIGPFYTWLNNIVDDPIARRLDRVFVNLSWSAAFGDSKVTVLPCVTSDHCALLVDLGVRLFSRPKPFKFFSCWADHPSFDSIVAEIWSVRMQGTPFFRLYRKLKLLKARLKELNSAHFSDITRRVRAADARLLALRDMAYVSPSAVNLEAARQCALELADLKSAEESAYRQKSRVLWVKKGDQKSRFFFNFVKSRQAHNTIRQLHDDIGRVLESHSEMSAAAVGYYSSLLGSSNPVQALSESLVSRRVTEDQAEMLVAEVTDSEIYDALCGMPEEKAPGPDGYTVFFFKRCWHVVGRDVLDAVHSFFSSG